MQLASIQLPKREVAHSSAWRALYLTYTLKGHLWMNGWMGGWWVDGALLSILCFRAKFCWPHGILSPRDFPSKVEYFWSLVLDQWWMGGLEHVSTTTLSWRYFTKVISSLVPLTTHNIPQLMSCVHRPCSRFENKAYGMQESQCFRPNLKSWQLNIAHQLSDIMHHVYGLRNT